MKTLENFLKVFKSFLFVGVSRVCHEYKKVFQELKANILKTPIQKKKFAIE